MGVNLQHKSSIAQAINHDCELIMEAVRRLIDGTWRLQDDDQSYSWELFPRVRSSLIEHVTLEEVTVLPKLSPQERERHRLDHRRLLAQLWAVEQALVEMRAETFRGLLRVLQGMIQEHHQHFTAALDDRDDSTPCEAEISILTRVRENVL